MKIKKMKMLLSQLCNEYSLERGADPLVNNIYNYRGH